MQDIFDELYKKSSSNYKFGNLMENITCEYNILLAYRNIKNNKGSTTVGTDGTGIKRYENMDKKEFVKYIQSKFNNYFPKSVRRVEIPKPNGKTRPLGIPCMDDRIIQQCIKQILEPICEAKFYKHSYGFRPNRSAHHAIARCMNLIHRSELHYVVDIDIKGFFDNVNHSKLKKQMWNLGIQDKNLLSIIGKILKSEIQGIGIPTKGTPQGGIISPLLSNIVLNELDWWISSQWETFQTTYKFNKDYNRYASIKKTNLKEIWLVRYADDFKIFCRDYKTAQKIFIATKQWIKERLNLEISSEKSKITNMRKNYTEFLGIKLKVRPKKNKHVCQSRMCNKALRNTINKLKKQIQIIRKNPNENEVSKLNSIILGSHQYYNVATNISLDFRHINFLVERTLYNRCKRWITNKPKFTKTYKKLYGSYNGKVVTLHKVTIFPIYGCKTKPPVAFNQDINNYTKQGRTLVHDKLYGYNHLIEYLLRNSNGYSVEYNDNRISLIIGQNGKCHITGEPLKIGRMECHHKKPKQLGGTDEYKNLVWMCINAHELIHATKQETISKYTNILKLDEKGIKRVNSLREQVGNLAI